MRQCQEDGKIINFVTWCHSFLLYLVEFWTKDCCPIKSNMTDKGVWERELIFLYQRFENWFIYSFLFIAPWSMFFCEGEHLEKSKYRIVDKWHYVLEAVVIILLVFTIFSWVLHWRILWIKDENTRCGH